MDVTAIIGIITAAVGAVGGWEAIKYFVNRKTNQRKAEAEADSVEFGVLKETVEFLEQQLHEKEQRFCEQTDRLRKVQDDYFALMQKNNQTELDLQRFRCVRPKCANREPQNGY